MKATTTFAILIAAGSWTSACLQPQNKTNTTDMPVVTDKPFVAGGQIEMQLDGGGYEIQASADNHIRVTLSRYVGNAKAEVTANGTRAEVKVTDTPHGNFHASVEVPKTTDLVVRLTGGELAVGAIAGNKDMESYGGNMTIAVGNSDDYSSVDASVKAGNIDAGVFGGSKSGLLQHFTWSGHGKYTLRANLGAGNLVLRK